MRLLQSVIFTLFVFSLQAQFSISGNVTNANGEPLIQATVFLVDTYYAAVTDEKGSYTLDNVDAGDYRLKVSYVGYKSYDMPISVSENITKNINLGRNILEMESIEISANRVSQDAAFAYTNLDKETLEKENLGTDIPFLLRWTPSVVTTSDAGTGIGYTGIRIRGTGASRINVTINGIGLNDAESQGVFWVNMPDFMTSVNNVQIQRGVGTSTNGAGAFGGTLSLNTNTVHENPYATINSTAGSFNTRKLSVSLGTGLLNGKYAVDGRYSIIKSDGYIDRGSADLKSWYFSAARMGEKSSLKLLAFSGKERTYQAWWGSPESRITGTQEELQAHYDRNAWAYPTVEDSLNLFEAGRTYNFYTYPDQVDDYQQDHYQLHYSLAISPKVKVNASAHYTRGRGFFEEFNLFDSFSAYPGSIPETLDIDGNPITTGSVVRRRWLDNDYYGMTFSGEYDPSEAVNIQLGGAISNYVGDHFGNVVKAGEIENVNRGNKYYEGLGEKSDANIFAKTTVDFGKLDVFGDLQLRSIGYKISGVDDDLTPLSTDENFNFFNPKFGLTYHINRKQHAYASFAVANREPSRSDFVDNRDISPEPETLYDVELGYRYKTDRLQFEWNNYLMFYKNQLVLSGEVNDVGAFIRTNVGESSRIGAELALTTKLMDKLYWNVNTTLSTNKVKSFNENIYDYLTENDIVTNYENTDISFSPSIIASNSLLYKLRSDLDIELSTKYVGKQYLDNTMNEDRVLPAYTFSNLRMSYDWDPGFIRNVKINAMINNIFDAKYSSNGYTYSSYYGEDLTTENFVYPQAGIHFMLGLTIDF